MFLRGEALNLIGGLSRDDYRIGIGILRRKYGNKSEYIRQLHSELSLLKHCQTFQDVKNLAVQLDRLSRLLEKENQDITGPQTYLCLEQKLTNPILREVLREKAKEPATWTTTKLRECLADIVAKEEALETVLSHAPRENSKIGNKLKLPPNGKDRAKINNATLTFAVNQTKGGGSQKFSNKQYKNPEKSQSKFKNPANKFRSHQSENSVAGGNIWTPTAPCKFCGGPHAHYLCKQFDTVNKRSEKLQLDRKCFRCLKGGHFASACVRPSKPCYKCKRNHNQALCPEWDRGAKENSLQTRQPQPQLTVNVRNVHSLSPEKKRAVLMCLQVTVFNPSNPSKKLEAVVFLDPGSHRSFVETELADKLGLPSLQLEKFALSRFGDGEEDTKNYSSYRVKLGLLGQDNNKLVITANKMDKIVKNMPSVSLSTEDSRELAKHGKSLYTKTVKPGILLGIDLYNELEIKQLGQLPSGFHHSTSLLGEFISGEGNTVCSCQIIRNSVLTTIERQRTNGELIDHNLAREDSDDESLSKLVKNHFKLEGLGMDDELVNEREDLMEKFRQNIVFKHNRYQVSLLWNDRKDQLPTNYKLARGRLISNIKQLQKRPEVLKQYNEIIQEQIKLGIVEVLSNPKIVSGPLHNLPHQAVVRNDKVSKVRVVYDGSAKDRSAGSRGLPSLNDCLSKGPSLIKDLAGILLRIRRFKILIASDLEKAFLQIAINESDRDACRFLWLDDPFCAEDSLFKKIKVLRFKRVSFGLNCSPFLLNATIQEHLALYSCPLAQKIKQNIYVDNILVQVDDQSQIVDSCKSIIGIFNDAGMNAREFVCNEPYRLNDLPVQKLAPNIEKTKILGIHWDTIKDTLQLKLPSFSLSKRITRRTVLAHIASTFDPLGLLSPVLLPAKILLSEICKEQATIKWDGSVSPEKEIYWRQLMLSWENVYFDLPRFTTARSSTDFVHTFADASDRAFGVAVYVASENRSQLVFGKGLIRPANLSKASATAPKMELQALAIAVKVTKFVVKELEMNPQKVILWSDSTCTIHRLKSNQEQDRFTMNRIVKIREAGWTVNHVSGIVNPADLASRGLKPSELIHNDLWWVGPELIRKGNFSSEPSSRRGARND
jgi:hypothetical protein